MTDAINFGPGKLVRLEEDGSELLIGMTGPARLFFDDITDTPHVLNLTDFRLSGVVEQSPQWEEMRKMFRKVAFYNWLAQTDSMRGLMISVSRKTLISIGALGDA